LVNKLLAYFPRWSIVAFLALVALGSVTLAAPSLLPQQQAGVPFGVDSLTEAEAAEAMAAATMASGVRSAGVRASALMAADGSALTAPAQTVVLTERHDEGKAALKAASTTRRADVYTYNYIDDTLQHALYDYDDKSLTVVETVQGTQFPLTQEERALAVQIAFADSALFAVMQEEYRTLTHSELIDASQLNVRPFIFHAGSTGDGEPPAVAQCGIQRCAQLLIVAEDATTFHALPVINLSTLSVASIFPLALDPAVNPGPSAGETHGDDGHSHAGGE